MTDTYACSSCGATVEREYGVQYIVLTCPSCGEHGRLVHESLVATLEGLPEEDRPDDWEGMGLDDRLLHAVREGLIDREDVEIV